MSEVVIMPKLGFNMDEGKLVQWYKNEGDAIKKGENFFSIETDKTNIDIEATSDGVVRKLLIGAGDKIPVTLPIAIIASADENIDKALADALAQLGQDAPAPADAAPAAAPAAAVDATSGATVEAKISPELAAVLDPNAYDYEILVIGGGPGGYVAAIKAAQMGKKTALVEKEKLGGTCLNVGCIPTKALLRSAEALHEVKECAKFGVIGVDGAKAGLDMKKAQERKKGVVTQLVTGVGGLLKKNKVTVLEGEAVMADAHTVKVGGKSVTAANIIIATGSVPKMLPIPTSPKMPVLTSTEALELTEAPKSIAVIGGGVIGMEFAYLFAQIGAKVTVIEFLDRILPMVDEDITKQVTRQMKELGMTIYTSAKVTEITAKGVKFEFDGKTEEVSADQVLMAVGRGPRLDGIDTEKLGIKTDRGAIVTNERLQTSVPGVYAIGDVNGKAMLAHTASMEGIIAVENICGHTLTIDYDKVPSAMYSQPEIASVGLTEEQAKAKHGKVTVGKFPMMANGKAKVAGLEKGLVKVIIDPQYGEILGVHMYCIHATDMIAEAVVAMQLEGTAEEVAMSIHPHPTVSEVLHEAMHAAVDGSAIHA